MTSSNTPWSVELTRPAERDLRRFRGDAYERMIRSISRLERDPMLGEPLTGQLTGTRSLHFSLPGSGQFRAAYVCLAEERVCLVFAISSRENFYREAERRWNAMSND